MIYLGIGLVILLIGWLFSIQNQVNEAIKLIRDTNNLAHDLKEQEIRTISCVSDLMDYTSHDRYQQYLKGIIND